MNFATSWKNSSCPPGVWKALAEGEYSPKYDRSVSLSIFWTTSKPSLFSYKVRCTCLFVIFEMSICCRSSAAFGWGSASAIQMYPCRFLLTSHCRRLSEIGISMISSSAGSTRCDTSEEVFRLWLGRIANRSARILFWLCGEREDDEIDFKEITLCMMSSKWRSYY